MSDPRFDPRFQRGYSGPQPDPSSMPVPPFERRAEGKAGDSPAVDPAEAAPRPAPDAATIATDDLGAVWTPPRRNPFALTLLIGGAAMIAIGAWLVWTLATTADFSYDADEQAVLLLQQLLSPALLICGVLGIAGWLVLGALAASGRRRD